jgi:flagellar biosynthesis chaperone FliJ
LVDKLYDLKNKELEQLMASRANVVHQRSKIDEEIASIRHAINTTSIDRYGVISDFAVLQMHKNTLKNEIAKLIQERLKLDEMMHELEEQLKEIYKHVEQFKYLKEQEKLKRNREKQRLEEKSLDEFVQTRTQYDK